MAEPERITLTAILREAEGDALELRRHGDKARIWTRARPELVDRIRRIDHELNTGAPDTEAIDVPGSAVCV